MAAAPSISPLDASLQKILGQTPVSKATGTQVPVQYDPNATFRPSGDVINLSSVPGTGVTTPEQWTHEIQLENLRREALQTEFEQRTKTEEAARAAAQLELQKSEEARRAMEAQQQFGLAQAGETRQATTAAQQYGLSQAEAARQAQTTAAQLASTRQQMDIARAVEQRAADEQRLKYGGLTADQMLASQRFASERRAATGGAAVGSPLDTAYMRTVMPSYVGHPNVAGISGYNDAYGRPTNPQSWQYTSPAIMQGPGYSVPATGYSAPRTSQEYMQAVQRQQAH